MDPEVRRATRAWHNPETECEDTDDLYQLIQSTQLVAGELHRRSPATRSYTQAQARHLFESARFRQVDLYHEFTSEPVRPDDAVFTVVGQP